VPDRAVYKSTGVEDLDDFYSRDPDPPLPDALDRGDQLLDEPGKERLSQAAGQFTQERANQSNSLADEMEGPWLQEAGSRADKVVRLGYKAAIQVAREGRDEPLPIETFFVTGVCDQFELHICEGKRQVTVLLFMPGERAYGSQRAASRSWIVRAGQPDEDGADVLDAEDPVVVKIMRSGEPRS
jgi:hypothetical protein